MRFLFLATLLTGCLGLGDTNSAVEGEGEGEGGDRDDCKIEGDKIGQDGVVLTLGAKKVTFGSWVPKSGSPGEYVGFTLSVNGSVSYVVKASGELYPGTETTWVHPAGADGGAKAPGISNVDFCGDPDAGGGGGEDGDGGSDDCNGGDGCGGGDGDGGPIIL